MEEKIKMMEKNKVKAVIFDLDGTLADTLGTIKNAMDKTFSKFSLPERSLEDIRQAIGCGARMLIAKLMPPECAASDEYVDRVLEYYDARYRETFLDCGDCYDGVKETVLWLSDKGIKLAVLSNKQDYQTKALVNSLFPEGVFLSVRGQTDLPKKPDPTVPLMIADELSVNPSECAYVGDSEVDRLTAENAGMIPLVVGWGYRTRDELAENGIDNVIADANALRARLIELI